MQFERSDQMWKFKRLIECRILKQLSYVEFKKSDQRSNFTMVIKCALLRE